MAAKKKAVTKKPSGNITVKIKTFRGTPVIPGAVFFTTGKLRHPNTLVVPAVELEGPCRDLVEIVGEESDEDDDFLD